MRSWPNLRKMPHVGFGTFAARVAHSSGQPAHGNLQVTVEFELLEYIGD